MPGRFCFLHSCSHTTPYITPKVLYALIQFVTVVLATINAVNDPTEGTELLVYLSRDNVYTVEERLSPAWGQSTSLPYLNLVIISQVFTTPLYASLDCSSCTDNPVTFLLCDAAALLSNQQQPVFVPHHCGPHISYSC